MVVYHGSHTAGIREFKNGQTLYGEGVFCTKSPVLDSAEEKHGEQVRKEQAEKEKTQAEVQADVEAAEAAVDGDFTSSVVNQDELDAIKAAAEKDGTFMKAPNGKPTNLTEQQWLQVRTKAFTDWFGDWESAAYMQYFRNRLLGLLAPDVVQKFAGKEYEEIKKSDLDKRVLPMAYIPLNIAKLMGEYVTDNLIYTSDFRFVDHVLNHHPEIKDYERYVDDLLNAFSNPEKIYLDTKTNSFLFLKNEQTYFLSIANPPGEGQRYIQWKTAYHSHKLQGSRYKEIWNKNNREPVGADLHDKGPTRNEFPSARLSDLGSKRSIKEVVRDVKPENVSKVVDENGEPRVMYHGTSRGDFTVFSTSNQWGYGAAYFANRREVADIFAAPSMGHSDSRVYEVFVNLRNPLVIEANNARYFAIPRPEVMGQGDSTVDTQQVAAFARDNGYDGVIVRDVNESEVITDDVLVFEPSQIKSATDNRGTFDGSSGDITMSVNETGDYHAPWEEYEDEGASFSVIGPSAQTWDKYEDSRKFKGRDDGKDRVEIDASQAKLTPRAFLGDAGDEYRLMVAGKAMPFNVEDDLEKLREQQKLIDGWYHILFETDDVDKAQEYSHEHGMTQEWWSVNTALMKNVKEFVARHLQFAGVTGEGKYGNLLQSNGKLMGLVMESLISGKVNEEVAAELDKMSGGYMKCLKDVLDYEELYEAYPDLKWLPVGVADLGYELRGRLFVKGGYPDSIELNVRLDDDGRRSTLLHEIQHAIQNIEEFAKGGTAEKAGKVLEKQVRQYRIRLEHLRHEQRWLYAVDTAKDHLQRMLRLFKRPRAILKMGERFAVHEMQHVPTMAAQAIEMMWKEYTEIAMRDYGDSVAYAPGDGYRLPGHGDKKPTLVAVEELLEKLKALPSRRAGTLRGRRQKVEAEIERLYEENKHKLNMTDMSGSELYLRLAGEIESRNVQERRDWSMSERMARPFNETLEYPGEALVSFSVAHVPLYHEILDAFEQRLNKDNKAVWVSRKSGNNTFTICSYPEVLNAITPWMDNVLANKDVIKKLMNKHHMLPQDVAKLPYALWDPIAVFEDPKAKNGGFIVVSDIMALNNEGAMKHVMVVLELKADNKNAVITDVKSAYSVDKTDKYEALLRGGYLRYADTERALMWAGAEGDSILQLLTTALLHSGSGVILKENLQNVNTDFSSSIVNLDEQALASEVVAAGQGFRANLAFSEQIVREMRGALLRMKNLGSKTRTEREDAIAAMGTMVQVVKAAVAYLPQGYRFSVHPYLNKLEVLAELATTGDLKMTRDMANKTIKEWLKLNQGIDDVVAVKGLELDRQTSAEELAKEYGEMQLQEAMEAIMHRVAGQLRKHAKDRAVLKIKELVERLAPKRDPKTGKLKGGKMSADAYRDIADVASAMGMNAEELEAKLAALRAELEKDGLSDDRRAQLESELTLYDQFGDVASMTAEEAVEALEALRQRVWFHRFEWDNVQAERRAARRAMVRSVVDGVGEVGQNEYNARKRAVKPTKRLKNLADILSGMPAVLTGLRGYLPLHKLADNLAMRANKAGEAIKKWEAERWVKLEALSRATLGKSWRKSMDFMHEVLPTGVTFNRPRYRSVSVKTAALRELLAMTPEERRAEMKRRRDAGGLEAETVLTERDIEELEKKLSAMEEKGKVLSTVETRYVASVQREENLQLSRGEALYAILMYEQPRYTERMEAQGYTPEVIVGLKRFIGEGMLQFGYGLRELFALQGERIARVYEATFGVPFPREENYFAARWNVTGMKENPAEQLLAGMAGTPGAGNGWMKPRVDHNLELDMTKDALQVFLQATTLTDTWMATQDIVADFKAWTRDSDFDRAMMSALGKDDYENLKDWIRIVELGGVQDCLNMGVAQDVINGLYGSGAVAILGFRIQTLLRQLPAIFNGLLGAHDISAAEWVASLSRMKNAEAPMTFTRMMNSTLIRNRRQGKANNMAGQAMRANDTASSMTEGLLLASMLPMEYVDASCTAMSLVPVWNVYYARAIEKGASVQEAEQAAWEQTTIVANLSSQPIGWLNKSKVSQSRNPLVRAVFYMLSENTAKFAMCRALWRGGKTKAAVRAWLIYGAANAAISALLDALQGDPDEFEKGKWWEYVVSAIYGPLASIPGVGEMVEAAGTFALNMTGEALGIDELKKAKTRASVGRALLDVQGFIKAWRKIYGYLTDDEAHSLAEYTRAASTISRTMAIGTGWMGNTVGYWSTVAAVLMNPIDFGARVWRNMKHYFD